MTSRATRSPRTVNSRSLVPLKPSPETTTVADELLVADAGLHAEQLEVGPLADVVAAVPGGDALVADELAAPVGEERVLGEGGDERRRSPRRSWCRRTPGWRPVRPRRGSRSSGHRPGRGGRLQDRRLVGPAEPTSGAVRSLGDLAGASGVQPNQPPSPSSPPSCRSARPCRGRTSAPTARRTSRATARAISVQSAGSAVAVVTRTAAGALVRRPAGRRDVADVGRVGGHPVGLRGGRVRQPSSARPAVPAVPRASASAAREQRSTARRGRGGGRSGRDHEGGDGMRVIGHPALRPARRGSRGGMGPTEAISVRTTPPPATTAKSGHGMPTNPSPGTPRAAPTSECAPAQP